jgi:hypothetical protein
MQKTIDRTRLAALTLEYGHDGAAEIAAALGCLTKSVYRIWEREYGYKHTPKPMKIDRDVLESLTEQWGHEAAAQIADHFDVHVDSIYRIWREEYGWRRPGARERVTAEQQARIDLLAREGLPSTWIAEDVGLKPSTVRDHRPVDAPFDVVAWHSTWQFIRRHLLEWHQQFAPKSEDARRAERALQEDIDYREAMAA